MNEETKILKAQQLVTAGDLEPAEKLMRELYKSKNPLIKLNAILLLDAVVNPVEENEKLLKLAEEGLTIATQIGANGRVWDFTVQESCISSCKTRVNDTQEKLPELISFCI